MKRYLRALLRILGLVCPLLLMGAGNSDVYLGIVRSVKADRIVILQKNGVEKTFKISAATRSFVSGKLLSVKHLKRNSAVQIAVDDQDVCLQIVADEVPK